MIRWIQPSILRHRVYRLDNFYIVVTILFSLHKLSKIAVSLVWIRLGKKEENKEDEYEPSKELFLRTEKEEKHILSADFQDRGFVCCLVSRHTIQDRKGGQRSRWYTWRVDAHPNTLERACSCGPWRPPIGLVLVARVRHCDESFPIDRFGRSPRSRRRNRESSQWAPFQW